MQREAAGNFALPGQSAAEQAAGQALHLIAQASRRWIGIALQVVQSEFFSLRVLFGPDHLQVAGQQLHTGVGRHESHFTALGSQIGGGICRLRLR